MEHDRSNGRVVLNVGGRLVETTITTLASSSTYFASLFSDNWSRQEKEHPFIDQDPDAFAVLLSYMRRGFVREEELSDDVLFQAEFFGVEDLVDEVKTIAYFTHNPGFAGTDDEARRSFEEEFGSICEAVTNGFLPDLLRRTKQPLRDSEYATLYLHFSVGQCDGRVIPCHAGLCFRTGASEKLPTDAGGFMHPIFALNFLGKFGFRLAPRFQNYVSPSPNFASNWAKRIHQNDFLTLSLTGPQLRSLDFRGFQLGEWVFERERKTKYEDRRLIVGPSSRRKNSGPREYASLVWSEGMNTFITAAGGVPLAFERLGGAVSRNVGIKRLKNTAAALEWLHSKGFIQREEELETIFESAATLKHQNVPTDNLGIEIGRTMIFSRPLMENEPLLDHVIPLAFSPDEVGHMRGSAFPKSWELSSLPYSL